MRITSHSTFFLSQRVGRWRWPWMLLSVPLAVIGMMISAGAWFATLTVLSNNGFGWAGEAVADDGLDSIVTSPPALAAELLLVGLTFWVGAVIATVVHGRPVRSLVEPLTRFRWSILRKILGFELLALALLAAPVPLFAASGSTRFTGFDRQDLIWLLPMAIFILIQTSGEDVFIKGYLLRQLGAVTKLVWFAPLVVVGLFVSLHIGNDDVSELPWLILPLFVLSELVIVYLMMRTGGMEVPLTLHWTNNAAIMILVADRLTQANDLTLVVYDKDLSTLNDDYISSAFYLVYLASQLVAFTWARSPFYLEPHNWEHD